MHICLIASEFFGFGIAGGFGFATRSLGKNLSARGCQVTAAIPLPVGHTESERVFDGVRVLTFPRKYILNNDQLYQFIRADIYHSQEPSLSSFVAQRAMPEAKHLVTARDPRCFSDWWIEFKYPTKNRLQLLRTAAFYENPFTRKAVRQADRVFVPAKYLAAKVQKKYSLATPPEFMPTPVPFPKRLVVKSDRPLICYLGRLARRKRPELFFDLAKSFPEVEFLVVGGFQDTHYEQEIQRRYGWMKNVRLLGFVDQFSSEEFSELLSKSWIMVNTAAREGLPNAFIEAAAYGCAIVSAHDPDQFVSRFGCHCPEGNYAAAVATLLKHNQWQSRGVQGSRYVMETNAEEAATGMHLQVYRTLLGES